LKWIEAIFHVIVANLVPLWGFTQQSWSPGTTLALYWLQTLIGIPLLAILVIFHRRITRKAGHYAGTMTIRDSSTGGVTTKKTTFLSTFLLMSIPFTLAHGVFLFVLLGLIWKNSAGAIDGADLRSGAMLTLQLMTLGFAMDLVGLKSRSFHWIELRAGTVLQRTFVVHLAIVFGMGLAALTGLDAAAFFAVFIGLKVLMDILAELPEWNPKEAPAWLVRAMNRIGDKKEDFADVWRRERAEQHTSAELAERTLE